MTKTTSPTPTGEQREQLVTRDAADGPSRSPRPGRQLALFLTLAYGLSWWPSFGLLANPHAAPVIPIGPSIAALVVVGWFCGRPAVRVLFSATVKARIGRWWGAAALPFAVAAATATVTVLAGGAAPSGADIGTVATTALATLPFVLLLNGPLGEEIGWRGYVLPLFLRRHSPITATLLLIPLWIAFHLPLILTAPDRFGPLWACTVVGMAFTMTWLHLGSGGSVLLAIVFHAVVNTTTPAAIRLFSEDDQFLAVRVIAAIWLLTGAAVALGPLRRARRPRTTDLPRAATASDHRPAHRDHPGR